MKVRCEACGAEYQVDPESLRGKKRARGRCRCGEFISIDPARIPGLGPAVEGPGNRNPAHGRRRLPEDGREHMEGADEADGAAPYLLPAPDWERPFRRPRLRLAIPVRAGLLFLLVLLSGAGLLVLADLGVDHLLRVQEAAVREASRAQALALAEQTLTHRVRAAAEELAMFLDYSDLAPAEYMDDPDFRALALHGLGPGTTAFVFSRPDDREDAVIWAHEDAALVGVGLGVLQERLGPNAPAVWRVIEGIRGHEVSGGRFHWMDPARGQREKIMVCAGITYTPLVLAAFADVEDIVPPLAPVGQATAARMSTLRQTLRTLMVAGGLGLFLLCLIFVHRLARQAAGLSAVARALGMRQPPPPWPRLSFQDEFSGLAESVEALGISLRLAMQRLGR